MRRLYGRGRMLAAVLAVAGVFLTGRAYGQQFTPAPTPAEPVLPGTNAPQMPPGAATWSGPAKVRLLDERDQKFLSALYVIGAIVALLILVRAVLGPVLRARRSPTLLELAESDPWLRQRLQQLRSEQAAEPPTTTPVESGPGFAPGPDSPHGRA